MSALITAVAISAVGAGVSAYSSAQAGKASQALGNYNAQVGQLAADSNADRILQTADFNRSVADQNEQQALRDSATEANNVRFNNRRVLASQRARIAASGVVGESGSPLMVQASQAGLAEMQALETGLAGQRRAGQYEQASRLDSWEATNDAAMKRWAGRSGATVDRMQGDAAAQAGYLNAGATVLQGAGKVFGGISSFNAGG